MAWPPSISMHWPTMNSASLVHSQAIKLPTSSGVPARPRGMDSTLDCHSWLRGYPYSASLRAVSVVPGLTPLTLIPWGARPRPAFSVRVYLAPVAVA